MKKNQIIQFLFFFMCLIPQLSRKHVLKLSQFHDRTKDPLKTSSDLGAFRFNIPVLRTLIQSACFNS